MQGRVEAGQRFAAFPEPLSTRAYPKHSLAPSEELTSIAVPKVTLMLSATSIGRFLPWGRGQKPAHVVMKIAHICTMRDINRRIEWMDGVENSGVQNDDEERSGKVWSIVECGIEFLEGQSRANKEQCL